MQIGYWWSCVDTELSAWSPLRSTYLRCEGDQVSNTKCRFWWSEKGWIVHEEWIDEVNKPNINKGLFKLYNCSSCLLVHCCQYSFHLYYSALQWKEDVEKRKEHNGCIEHTLLIVLSFLFHAITKLSLLRLSQYVYCKVHCYNVFVLLPHLLPQRSRRKYGQKLEA